MNILINSSGIIPLFLGEWTTKFWRLIMCLPAWLLVSLRCITYWVLDLCLGASCEDGQTHVWSIVAVGLLCISERVLNTIKDAEQISCDEKD